MKIAKIFCWIFLVIFFCPSSGSAKDKTWNEEKSSHFIIFYKNAPKDFVKNVEKMAEHYYDEIYENLGLGHYHSWSWDDRAKLYIYDGEDDYVATARQYGCSGLSSKYSWW